MRCPACQHDNRERAKFCEECATALPRNCSACGSDLRATARFCDECGLPVDGRRPATAPPPAATAEEEARKTVSIVFADLAGSTSLHERLDAEAARAFMEHYYSAMRSVVEAHGGRIAKLLGDGVLAVFGVPVVAEDDALRAVRSAVAMQESFARLAERHGRLVGEIGLRVAVNTGEVVVRGESELIGDPVNVAARLQDQAGRGDVVVGESTRHLVAAGVTLETLGTLTLRGRAEAVPAYRVASLEPPATATAAAFVGRVEEMERLRVVFDSAVETPRTRLAVLLGSPGLGKSRLIAEFLRSVGNAASVVAANCDAAGGSTFAPLAAALRDFLGLPGDCAQETIREALARALPETLADRDRIRDGATAVITGSPAPPEESFFVVRRLLSTLAGERPVVLVLDDLQWAAPLLLDLIEHLVQWGSGTRLLVLVGARPELRDARSALASPGGIVADLVTLGGLDARAATKLAANVLGASDLPAAVAARVLGASEGNPLFVGELVRMLVQEGALQRDGDRWTVGEGLASLEMPPTIHALLSARIERLRPEDRVVLERAAVVGRLFSRSAIAELLPDATDLDARLESLRRAELIEADPGWFLGEPGQRFHHTLIRDAAYRRLLKHTRADLHRRLAEWIETRTGGSPEHDETIGRHLEQAHHHLRELGPLDAAGRSLGQRAATRLAAAGRRALARDDLAVASDLLGRALDCLEAEDGDRAELALDWCEALLSAGEVARATAAVDELGRLAGDAPRLRAWQQCFAAQLAAWSAPQTLRATAEAVAAAAGQLAELGDSAGAAKAHSVHAQILARLGRVGACESALDRALAAARAAGDRRRANAVLAGAPLAALWGPSPVTRASGRCLDVVRVLRITQGAPAVEAVALGAQGVLEALRGRTDAARRMVAASRRLVEELGITHRLLEADVCAARIDLLEGNAAVAETTLRGAYAGLRELGLGSDSAQAGALLARALLAQGCGEEAEAISRECETLAGDDLQAAIAWRGVRAEALAARGEHTAAVELAEQAVAIASATDALLDHASARRSLAVALRAGGHVQEAERHERHAWDLWTAKGAARLEAAAGAGEASRVRSHPQGEPDARAASRRRVTPNAATRNFTRYDAAVNRNDIDGWFDLFADDLRVVHHATGSTYDKAGLVEGFQRVAVSGAPVESHTEPLATLGERVALGRAKMTGTGRFVAGDEDENALPQGGVDEQALGSFEMELLMLVEVDDSGRRRRVELFGTHQLQDALVRIFAVHAESLPPGPHRDRVAATGAALGVFMGASPGRIPSVMAEDAEMDDHRRITGMGTIRGRDAMAGAYTTFLELTEDSQWLIDDVLCLREDGLVTLSRNFGRDKMSGGDFERPVHCVLLLNDESRIRWTSFFDGDEDGAVAAIARFEAAGRDVAPPTPRSGGRRRFFENDAWAAWRRMTSLWSDRDDDGLREFLPPGFRFRDRRSSSPRELDRDDVLELLRVSGGGKHEAAGGNLEATREERLALCCCPPGTAVIAGAGETAFCDVVETNEEGRPVAVVRFDAVDLDAAYEELERRSEALHGGAIHDWTVELGRRIAARDWDWLTAAAGPALDVRDGRLVGAGAFSGSTEWVGMMKTLVELAPDARMHAYHRRICEHGTLTQTSWIGTRDGGAFESGFLAVMEQSPDGTVRRMDIFDPGHPDRAWARFEDLARAGSGESPFENVAATQWRLAIERWRTKDWKALADHISGEFRIVDRRALVQLELDRDAALEWMRSSEDWERGESRWELLATRGERLCLTRWKIEVQAPDGGPGEIESLDILQTDRAGRFVAQIRFDPADLELAFEELQRRYERDEPQPVLEWARAFDGWLRDRDWTAMTDGARDVVGRDHRLVSWESVRGGKEWTGAVKTLVELAPDVRLRVDHVRAYGRFALFQNSWVGTREGGEFENVFLTVLEVDPDCRLRRQDIFDPAQGERALALLHERIAAADDAAAAGARPAPGSGEERDSSSWTRLADGMRDLLGNGDAHRLRALASEDFVFEDHARRSLVKGGIDAWIESLGFLARLPGFRLHHELLGRYGARIRLSRARWHGGEREVEYESEKLNLAEFDEDGRLAAVLIFDPEDHAAATGEAVRRFAAGEGRDSEGVRAWARLQPLFQDPIDWDAVAAQLHPDLVLDDRRPLGFGRLNGQQWLDSLRAQNDLAPDLAAEALQIHAWNRRAVVLTLRTYGTLRDGGPFENLFVGLFASRDEQVDRAEPHAEADLQGALRRLEELGEEGGDDERARRPA